MNIGAKIREAREKIGWTVTELAAALGMSTSNLSRIETGENAPRYEQVEQIAETLGVSMRRFAA